MINKFNAKEIGKLDYGMYSNRQKTLGTILTLLFSVIYGILFYIVLDFELIVGLILMFLSLFSTILFINLIINDFEKALRKYNKTLDIKQLENKVQELLRNNLHSETRKETLLRYSIILLAYDKEQAINLFSTLEEPKNMFWYGLYETNKVEYFINQGNKEVAQTILEQLKLKNIKNPGVKKTIDTIEKVYFLDGEFPKLEKNFKIFSKEKGLLGVSSLINLMNYYVEKNRIEEAKECANKFLSLNTKMYEFEKQALKVLEL